MNKIKIPKRGGGTRTIYAPSPKEKDYLRGMLLALEAIPLHPAAHGFTAGHSPITAAQAHAIPGAAYTVSIDLADCFDHVTPVKLKGYIRMTRRRTELRARGTPVPRSVAVEWPYNKATGAMLEYAKVSRPPIFARCFVGGAARQGLPTSPALCNIALRPLDKAILSTARRVDPAAVYTRYADNLDVTTSMDFAAARKILSHMLQACSRLNWPVNPKKTHIQSATAGRRRIAGVMVDAAGIHLRRGQRRRLRALAHKAKAPAAHWRIRTQARGLAEWAKLKPPVPVDIARKRAEADEWRHACAIMTAEGITPPKTPPPKKLITTRTIPNATGKHEITLTASPLYLLCSSAGPKDGESGAAMPCDWWSCHNIRKAARGSYWQGNFYWMHHTGVGMAVLWGEKHIKFNGVTMRKMLARKMIFKTANGPIICTTRTYTTDPAHASELNLALSTAGINPPRRGISYEIAGENTRAKTDPARPFRDEGGHFTDDGRKYFIP